MNFFHFLALWTACLIVSVQAYDFTYTASRLQYIKDEEFSSMSPAGPSGFFNTSLTTTGAADDAATTTAPALATTADTTAPEATSPTDDTPGALPSWAQSVLNAHNTYRARHGSPALTWSTTLADFAQNYADNGNDACSGNLVHSGTYYDTATGYGENLAVGFSFTGAVDEWYNEINNYDFDDPDASTGEIGHFTQLVWDDSRELGCGYYQCAPPWNTYLVCEYSPPGNVVGTYQDHVPRLIN